MDERAMHDSHAFEKRSAHLSCLLRSVSGSCSEPRRRLAFDCRLLAEDLTSCRSSRPPLRLTLLPSGCPICIDAKRINLKLSHR